MTSNHDSQTAPSARAGAIQFGLDVYTSSIVVVRQIDAQVAPRFPLFSPRFFGPP
jgi:hypothetical protein